MANHRSELDITLLDVLIDGFEKNEMLHGFHWRQLPLSDEVNASVKFDSFVEEATRWQGPASRLASEGGRRIAAWSDLEIRQLGRAIMVLVRAPNFSQWWHAEATWRGDPFGELYAWLADEPPGEGPRTRL